MAITVDQPAVRSTEAISAPASRNVLQIIWQRRALVLLGLAAGLVIGALVYARAQPVYRSSAQVLVIKKRTDMIPIQGGDPSQSYLEDYVSTHIALLKSPAIVADAVKSGKLTDLRTFAGQGDPGPSIISSIGATRDAPGGNNRTIINLTFQGPNPEETPVILDAVIASYSDFLEKAYKIVSRDFEEGLIKAQIVLKNDLAKIDEELRKFNDKAPIIWKGKDGVSLYHARVAELKDKQSVLRSRKGLLENRLKAFEKARKSGRVELALLLTPEAKGEAPGRMDPSGRSEPHGLEDQLQTLQLEEEELLESFGKDHPSVRNKRAKIRAIQERLERSNSQLATPARMPTNKEDLLEKRLRSITQELEQITVDLEGIDTALDDEIKAAKTLKKYEEEEAAIRVTSTRTQQLYDQTINRLKEVNLVRDFGGYDAKVIAPPAIGVRVAPSLLRTMLMAVFLGLVGGVGLAYLADVTDRSFRSPDEIRRRLGLPLLGHIPYAIETKKTNSQGISQGEAPLPGQMLCVHHKPTSMDSEAYRSLRTALYFKTQGHGHTVIQVTSPNMGDGKTTVTANLATAIAQSGKRVVVVDADFRRPRVHRIFGIDAAEKGVTSVLAGDIPLADAVRQTAIPGLAVLPCGTRPPNPAELLTARSFEGMLTELRSEYDFVLVDTPPLLAVTDPCVVAGYVDGVLLTIRVSKNGRPGAERAKELLANLGVNVMGVIVNGVGPDAGNGYGYRYYYYDDYRYEYRSSDAEGKRVKTREAAAS